jgi:prepilin-type N-terminal cleavage/methylation domain-containing protein
MKDLRRSAGGFTLVELLVSMVLSLVLLGAVYAVYKVQARTLGVQQNRQEAQSYARAVLDIMVREIRHAGANPLQTSSGANCAGTPTAGTPGFVTATSTKIKFTYDYRGTSTGSVADGNCDDPDEEITYEYQSPGPQGCAVGNGDIVRTANGTSEPITDCNVTAFSLAYYAKDSSTVMSPVVLTNIQRVTPTLTVQSKNPDAEFGGQLTATVSSNINLRNIGS